MTRKNYSLNRRKLLKTIGAGALTATTTAGVVYASNGDWVEIDYRWGPESLYRKVPEHWYNQYKHVNEVHRNNRYFESNDGVMGQSYHPGTFSGDPPRIFVYFHENASTTEKGKVPDEKGGIKIEKMDETHVEPQAACNEAPDHWKDPMHGGIKISVQSGGWGTYAGRFKHINKSQHFLGTAAHLFSEECQMSELEGNNVYHEWDKVGEVYENAAEEVPRYLDFAPIDPESDVDPSLVQHDPDTHYRLIAGLTEDGLAASYSEGHSIHKVGARTCHTQGRFHSMGGTFQAQYCPNGEEAGTIREQVVWGTNDAELFGPTCGSQETTCNGDSGALCFIQHPNPDDDNWFGASLHYGVKYSPAAAHHASTGTALYHIGNVSGYYV